MKKRFIAFMLAFCCALTPTVNASKSVSELKKELAEKQKETDKLKKQIKDKKSDKAAVLDTINNLDSQIDTMQSEIDAVQSVINEKQAEIDTANANIENLNNSIAVTKEKLKSRMKVMYEYGQTSYLEILLESKSFSDLFTRIAAIRAIVKHDDSIMDDYAKKIDEIQESKAIVESEQQEQIEAKAILVSKQDEIEAAKNEKNKIVEQLNSDISSLEEAEKQREKDEQALQAEINKALPKSSNVVYKGNGKFLWPSASSTRITSQFGYRTHPISGKKSLHRGIDIGAAAGTDVLAAEDGVVLTAGYNRSYGNYVTINHGGGYVTLYAHNSKLCVAAGQKVTKGQVIAKCGSTGNSTGPHIHFEVQVNGSLVNPLNYL